MPPMTARPAFLFAAIAAFGLGAGQAAAHPHIFAEARLDVVVAPDATVTSMRNLWRFDDLFSSTVLVEFDKNKDLKLDDSELLEVANTIYQSLAEFDYFQLVTHDGKDVAVKPPERLIASFEANQLVVLFETTTKEPMKLAGKVDFGVYDPTFYTAIDFSDDAHMAVENMPLSCKRQVIRPDPDQVLEENKDTLTDAFFNDPAGNDMTKLFATKLELTCPA